MNYEAATGHPPDFEVAYRFYTYEEGGRHTGPPFMGFVCNWLYAGDNISKGMYEIWPEFLNEDGTPLAEKTRVPISGTATMWIVSHDFRLNVHRNRIMEDTMGYFMEGDRKVAEAVVTRVVGLHTNSNMPREPAS